jgi:hypothetical protein
VNSEASHEQSEGDFQREPGAGVVFSPVTEDGVDREEGQDDEKKADHLIPQNVYRAYDAGHHMSEELFCH